MDRHKQKKMLYQALVDLAENNVESNRYFSPKRILGHVSDMFYKKYDRKPISEEIPNREFLNSNLEELVSDGHIEKIIAEVGELEGKEFGYNYSSNFYKAFKSN